MIVFLMLAAWIGFSCNQSSEVNESVTADTAVGVKDGVFIHISEAYQDAHRALMPLKMATMMAEDRDVLVYMDIHAVELLVKGAKELQLGDFEPAHVYIKTLLEKGVGVYACPTCLKLAGYTADDLMEGVQLANKEAFFGFTKGRILTLDY